MNSFLTMTINLTIIAKSICRSEPPITPYFPYAFLIQPPISPRNSFFARTVVYLQRYLLTTTRIYHYPRSRSSPLIVLHHVLYLQWTHIMHWQLTPQHAPQSNHLLYTIIHLLIPTPTLPSYYNRHLSSLCLPLPPIPLYVLHSHSSLYPICDLRSGLYHYMLS